MKVVSVCIPSYNASRHIRETIKSVLDSTYSHFEIIISDDASQDGTKEIVETFSDDRIHFYQNKAPIKVPKNWNRALEKASGEFIGVLNHDDLYGPFWLTFAVHVLEKHPHIGWVATATRTINDRGQVTGSITQFANTGEVSREEVILCLARLNGLSPVYIARREILEQAGYYEEKAGPAADADLYFRLALKHPLYYSSNPHHAAYRWHANNLSHQQELGVKIAAALGTFRRVFTDKPLSADLEKLKRLSYTTIYQQILSQALELLDQNNLETVQRLLNLMNVDGYGYRS